MFLDHHHITMIFEGSCDIEDWKFSFAITVLWNCNNISQCYYFCCFDQI